MSISFYLQPRYVGVISLLTLQGIFAVSSSRAACYSTPRIAIAAGFTSSSLSPALKTSGYRVTKIQSDPLLGQRWATIASCAHPEWPELAFPVNEASSVGAPQEAKRSLIKAAPEVRAGDIVRLWREDSLLRIELAGVSEDSGGIGKTIRVRLLHRNTDDQFIPQEFSGIVRGSSDVEIQP